MAPKKDKTQGPGKKPSATKVVEDRTFGMKNKKGASAQKQIQQMTSNLKNSGSQEEKRKQAEKAQREKEKKAAEDAKRELDALMNKPAQIQKVPFGVDPKTVVCIFYKKGDCEKGKKCKFSHDLAIDRKTEKRDLYTDGRKEEDEKKKAETSADWDEEKLRSVVLSKKGNQKTTTDKVCKYFVSAIEDGKYGWFWVCPNGGDKCMYKHALPPGYVPLTSSNLFNSTDTQTASSSKPKSKGQQRRLFWTSRRSRHSHSKISWSQNVTSSLATSLQLHRRVSPSGSRSVWIRRRQRRKHSRRRTTQDVHSSRVASGPMRMSLAQTTMTMTCGTYRNCERRRRRFRTRRRKTGFSLSTVAVQQMVTLLLLETALAQQHHSLLHEIDSILARTHMSRFT